VINLVPKTHRTPDARHDFPKQGLADGVLDRIGDIKEIKLKPGGQTFLSKLEQIISKSR